MGRGLGLGLGLANPNPNPNQSNLDACKLVQSLYGARRCIVQQIDPTWKPAFNDIGGLVSPA